MTLSNEEALFALALTKPADKRVAFLNAMCEGDAALRQRLDALLAAHEQPDDLLVTLHDGVPVPKVIDFGIAKATEGRLTDNTVYTQLHQFIGTPAYMSPEQAEMSGLDIDIPANKN